MVFESLVADLINKYLGEFVENLDRSQLKISVMRGRVKLRNLELKKSVLDDLDLPVELKAGHIENLSLTIPWTNLYSESVEVSIDGLYALAVPNVAIKYDPEKEEKAKQESKQKKLLKVEEFKRAATEKGTQKKEKDSFVEKMTVQIIKNLQIKIQNIHFRYEDGYTNPEHPISFGVRLAELQFHTTDEKWTPCAVKEVVNKIFKLVRINSLAVYWNGNSEQYASLSNEMMFERLKEGIARKDGNFAYHFLIKPISSEAHLELNMKPELENFSLPKVLLSVTFDEIEIRLSKLQYNGILELLESFERMYLMSAYRKYRPNVPVHNQAKAWWHFARDCVLKMKVRHRHCMFSWKHINHHRSVMKKYTEAYSKMLSNPNKVSPDVLNDIEECEAFLDVLSIILMRSKAEIEIARSGAQKIERPKGMFRGLFKKKGKGKTNIKEQFEKEFSANEKAKLYEAIGYQENEANPTFPKEYVAVRLETKFRSIALTVNDESKREPQILKLHLEGGLATLRQRPSERAVQIIGKIDNVTVDGTSQESSNVNLILSQNEDTENLLNFNLETKPLDGECHTRVSIESRPLQIIYDAVSINNVTEFFRPPKETYLKQLSRAAIAKFKDITKKSASGLKHAIEKHKYTDIHVDIRPSYIIIPHGGRYQEGSVDILVIDLGSLTVNSAKNTCGEGNQASAVEDSMSEAYENFKIDLERVQVLYARRGDNWNFVRQNMNTKSSQHVLLPISINLCLQKSMFDNNHQFPKWKISGNLPLLSLRLSDLRLQEIIQLVQSIPLPKVTDRDLEMEEIDVFSHILDINDDHLIETVELAELAQQENRTGLTTLHDEACKLFMEMEFHIGKVCICLQEYTAEGEIPMISLDFLGLGTRIITRKFDTKIVAFLGEIYLRHRDFKARAKQSANQEQIYSRISSGTAVDEGETLINMIKSLTDEKTNILTLTFQKADPKGPEFESTFQKIEQNIDITFTSLEVLLHQEALLSVMKFAAQLQQSLQVNLSSARSTMKNYGTENKRDSDPTTAKDRQVMARKSQKNRKDKARVILRVSANLKRFGLSLWTNTSVIASGCIDGISVAVVLHDNKTIVTSELKEVAVYDYNVITMYPKIVEIKGDAVFILKLTIYNNVTEGDNHSDKLCVDASVKVQIGCVRGVFLMRFVNDLLKYFTRFQERDLKSQIEAAKKKVREASGAVTESAKVAIKKLAKKSPHVEIDVSLDAPVIFVPERSDSSNVLMLDFGHIDIKNSFSLDQGSVDISAVLDTITIYLTSSKIARVQLNKENEVIAQCLVLEPLTANLSVTRNLAFKYYKKIPAVYISGQLDSIEVILSEGDCRAITTWLNENMSEGQITGSILVSSDAKNTDMNQEISKSADTDASSSSKQNQCDTECTQLKVQFNITFSSATLYSGESRLTTDGKNSRSIDQALGQFMIMGIAVECEMKNDKSTTMCVLVRDAIIDDKRRKKQAAGVKRMMEKCNIDTRPRRNNLLYLQFIQEPTKTKQVNVKVCSIRLVVCLDFLMPLAAFFTSAISACPTSLSFHRNLKGKVKDIERINLRVTADLEGFGVAVYTNNTVITNARIDGISAGVVIQDSKTVVTLELREVTVFDSNTKTKYPKIVEIKGDAVLRLKLTIYDNATVGDKYSDMSCVDTSVDVQLGCIRGVFLMRFVSDLLEYLNGFQVKEFISQIKTAKVKVRKASEAMTESAKVDMAQLAEKSPRVSIKVSMSAPVILVPQRSDSMNVLMVDFGHLDVSNSFSPVKTNADIPAVLDSMKIDLKSLKVARAELSTEKEVVGQCLVLEAVSLNLSVTRNLAFGWYKEIPAVDLSGHLESIEATISQGDYKVIMTLLSDNLSEKSDTVAGSSKVKDTELTPAQGQTTDSETTTTAGVPAITSTPPEQSDTFKLHTQLKFQFQINSLSATLYSGESTLTTDGQNSRSADQALGQFIIEIIGVKGEMKRDASLTTNVILKNTVVDDKRRQKQEAGIKRMIERVTSEGIKNNLIDVQFTQDPSQNKDVNVKVCSIRVVVCLDFLMPLAEFFTSGLPDSKPAPTTTENAHSKVATPSKPPPPPPPTSEMSVTVSMETPEIILIEDQMDLASNSLLLSFRMELKMEITPESQKVSACVRSLQTASAIFNEKDKQRVQILRPCDIDLNIKSLYWKYIDHINISISDVVLKISPQTIRTLALITVKLSKTKRQKKTTVNKTQQWNVLSDLWKTKTLSEEQFWFLKNESNEESPINDESKKESRVDDVSSADNRLDAINHLEHQLTVTVSNIFMELEGGVGKRTVPLLIAESSFDAIVKNWRSELVVNAKMSLKMAFYNEKLSVWEYLVEPVLENERIKMWNLDLQMKKNNDKSTDFEKEESKNRNLTSPNMSINIRSSVPMEVTVTNSCLDVLNNLVKTPPEMKNGKVTLATDKSLALYGQKHTTTEGSSRIDVTQAIDEKLVIFQIQQFGAMRAVTIKRSEKRLYPVNHRTTKGDTWAVVCSTEASIGQKILHLRSIVQMKNNLPHAVRVLAVNNGAEKNCGVVGPEEMFNVPLSAVYTEYGQFVVEPLDSGCGISGTFSWKDAEKSPTEYITCKYRDGSDYVICVKTEIINVYDNETEELSAKTYIIHLSPSIVFHNLLNIPISLLLEGKTSEILLENGENTPLIHVMPGKSTIEVNIPAYRDWEWHGSKTILTTFQCLSTWKFNPVFKAPKNVSLMLELHCKENQGSLNMFIYSPYWMINKTGMTLYYTYKDSESVIEHPPCTQGVVFFSFKAKQSGLQNKKALLRIDDSIWSKKFSLDTVGCSGTIQCESKSRTYEVGIKIRLSSSGLTKICTFTPLYMLLNTSEVKLLCAESTKLNKWIQIPPKSCLPFWPVQSWKNRKMIAKVEGSDYNTEPFDFSKPHTTFMKVKDKWGGINVDCQVAEAAFVTTLTTYKPGMATVLMINSTDNTSIKYNQSDEKWSHVLNPKEYVMYTWENIIGKRELEWSFGKNKPQKTNLMEDGKGSFFLNLDTEIYWVSFLDGPQRVLLFTNSDNVTKKVHILGFEERFEHEINISLHSIGVSLVNDTTQTEIGYLSITSSPTTWEEETRKDTYRALNVKTSENLEAEYQRFIHNLQQGMCVPETITINKAEVNFQEMRMIKPNNRMIRRSDHDGVWIQCKTSPRTIHVHAKINRFQVDSQTNIHAFHTVLAPVTPPTSVALDNVQKPIVEVSVVAVRHDHSDMLQFKYCKVLVQPIYVNVDNGFLNIIEFITPSQHKLQTSIKKRLKAFKRKIKEPYNMMKKELSEIENAIQTDDECIYRRVNQAEVKEPHTDKKEMNDADLKMVYGELLEETGLAKEQKHFFDTLHVSPLKVIFSQSIQIGERQEVRYYDSTFLSAVLQIQNVQEVVLRLGYFEKKNSFLNISQLISQIPRHYKKQAANQIYVLLFGLDVIGNPLGLLRGIVEGGADLFYEPYQGAIQGPGQFVEGLALGVRSLVGHTVVGTAGALHRISGSVGKGLAILTFDDEYQKKRQEGLNKKPANIGEGLLRGVKGLGTGVFHGFTGIVIRPIEGAQREGVGGLFKGIGKGLVGVITRPSSGVVDFVSSSFEAIKRTADLSDEVKRIRPPRRFYSDKIIRPFNFVEATGFNFLQETEEGMFAETDEYITHCVNTGDNISTKSIFLITDRRVIYAKKGVMLGHWEAEWSYTWDDLKERPKQHDEKVEFLLKDKRRSPFQKRRSTEIIKTSDSRIAEWLVSEISKAMNMK